MNKHLLALNPCAITLDDIADAGVPISFCQAQGSEIMFINQATRSSAGGSANIGAPKMRLKNIVPLVIVPSQHQL